MIRIELTPTQRDAADRRRAFAASIAAKAVPQEPTPPRASGIKGYVLPPPKPMLMPSPAPVLPPIIWPTIPSLTDEDVEDHAWAPGPARIDRIRHVVCKYYSVPRIDLLSARRTRNIVLPRQVAMYLAKTLTLRSLPYIGRRFGGRDHTTVLHAVRKIGRNILFDEQLAFDVARLIEAITGEQQ